MVTCCVVHPPLQVYTEHSDEFLDQAGGELMSSVEFVDL